MNYKANIGEEKKEILKRYRNLLYVWKPKSQEDRDMVKKAFHLAAEAHKDMRRKSGEPYIYHPLSVATIAAGEIGLGKTSIICALLHDVVEDTEYTVEDIRGLFGDEVAKIIDGLTKIKGIFDQRTASIQAENFKKLLLTLSDDVRVVLVKLADRLHNMRTLDAVSSEKKLKISSETMHLYAPLANRLGLHAIKSELQDLALKHTDPAIYDNISKRLKETEKERSQFARKFIHPLKQALAQHGIKSTIMERTKSIYSIWEKMRSKQVPFDEVYDIFAVRVVIDAPYELEKSECWKAYSIITDIYTPNRDRLRDWISVPKANGYEALHTTVMSSSGQWVEIQIRSTRMEDIAEKGYAAHWKYKESLNLSSRLDNWLDRIREMIHSPEADALSFMDDVKGYFFLDEISIFTPQGELRTLPAKSTVLDFAYAIHSEIGNTCIGAKVDKKLVPINHVLKNGEQVEILNSQKQSPKEDWLTHAITTRARSNIKIALKKERRKYLRHGKEKLEKWFISQNLSFTPENIKNFMVAHSFQSTEEMYFAASHDKLGIKDVKQYISSNEKSGWLRFITLRGSRKHEAETVKVKNDPSFQVDLSNLDKLGLQRNNENSHEFAACCNPIPGDEILALVASEDLPVQIHRTNCPKVLELISSFRNKFAKVSWLKVLPGDFLTGIRITGIDKLGLINDITRIISADLNLNIKSFNLVATDGLTEGEVRLFVQNTATLKQLMNNLKKIEGIKKVTRII